MSEVSLEVRRTLQLLDTLLGPGEALPCERGTPVHARLVQGNRRLTHVRSDRQLQYGRHCPEIVSLERSKVDVLIILAWVFPTIYMCATYFELKKRVPTE